MAKINQKTVVLVEKIIEESHSAILKGVGPEITKIVESHALGAAAAGLGAGWIPGVGGTAALVASAGFVWSMYYRINKEIGISLSKSILKSVATAIITNLGASYVAQLLVSAAFSFIPGLGTIGAAVTTGAVVYATTVVSGLVYLKVIAMLEKSGKNISETSKENMERFASETIKSEDFGKILKDLIAFYKDGRKNGDITGKEKVDLQNE